MEERSKRRATLERARTLGTVAVEAVKGQRGDRCTRAQMIEGGDECILSREKPGIRNIRLDREIKRTGIRLDISSVVPSKVVVNVPLNSTKRYVRVNESRGEKEAGEEDGDKGRKRKEHLL